jgi:serine/threonine-protein kinase
MGAVYRAWDIRLSVAVALKEMTAQPGLDPNTLTQLRHQFQQEATVVARLRHPSLVSVSDFFEEGANVYLVMTFVEGESLAAKIAREGALSEDDTLDLAGQLLEGLAHCHSKGVIHRDVKPQNVIIRPDKRAVLVDFGLVKLWNPDSPHTRTVMRGMGTPEYAPPEQYHGGSMHTGPYSDIYGLGATLYHALMGGPPPSATMRIASPDLYVAPRRANAAISSRTEAAISKALQIPMDQRFQSAEEMIGALGVQPGSRPVRRLLSLGLGIGAGLLVVVLAAAGFWLSQKPASPSEGLASPTVKDPTVTLAAASTKWASAPTVVATTERPPPTAPPSPVPATAAPAVASPTPRPAPPRLLYAHGNVGNTDIYVADADGSGRVCIACGSCDEAEPAWSPDGLRVVYQANCEGGSYDLWTASSKGGGAERLTRTGQIDEREPDWSPDGRRIVFRVTSEGANRNSDGDIMVMGIDGTGANSLGTPGRSPAWSPDGRKIAFMSDRSGSWQIYVFVLDGGTTKQLTDCSVNCRWPAWSPDGQHVIYHSTTGPGSVTADTIWFIPAAGGSPQRVVGGHQAGRPTWSSRGLIAFNSDRGIEIVEADGSSRRTLIAEDVNWAPQWSE